MPFTLMPLPYDREALAPHMSANTLDFHHDKHHKTYVDTLNKLILGTPYDKMPLEGIIEDTFEAQDAERKKIFNNAAQVWNHNFFWYCMTPKAEKKPQAHLLVEIEKTFGNFDDFKSEFKKAATEQFGSGWAWLVLDQGRLKITKTSNAENPLASAQKALLACDVWEHAYYLDYQNRRVDMITAFLDNLVNWDFVAQNLDATQARSAA